MDLAPYVEHLRQELAVAAEAGGDDARALAERLTAPLESAARLTLLNALSAAMGEVTLELAPGSVDVRLRGLDPEFVVSRPEPQESADLAAIPAAASPSASPSAALQSEAAGPPEVDEGGTARINLRVPTSLKSKVESAAARDGLSVNAWLVLTLTASLDGSPAVGAQRPVVGPVAEAGIGRRFTGWV
ncbi:toxin-antitoxin system HicB family antitoxin [Streptomyces sp. NBC_01012]|uniref:toxin-antitoxin system HicB family antitoxin n=1 Tax=Streptomyces sp. NBC_01012 TaxID=2903717 RepID=UPI00386B5FFA|nr:toxin-antitoxin system HicB family antitoxin [Streptomyces sp. NBC_01012]